MAVALYVAYDGVEFADAREEWSRDRIQRVEEETVDE